MRADELDELRKKFEIANGLNVKTADAALASFDLNSQWRSRMKITLIPSELLVAFGGAAFAAPEC